MKPNLGRYLEVPDKRASAAFDTPEQSGEVVNKNMLGVAHHGAGHESLVKSKTRLARQRFEIVELAAPHGNQSLTGVF